MYSLLRYRSDKYRKIVRRNLLLFTPITTLYIYHLKIYDYILSRAHFCVLFFFSFFRYSHPTVGGHTQITKIQIRIVKKNFLSRYYIFLRYTHVHGAYNVHGITDV